MCVSSALANENRLLAALPPEEYERLLPELQSVYLPRKQVIYQPGMPSSHVYFPLSGMVSELVVLEDARTVEVGVIGSEGVVGIHGLYGGGAAAEAIVQLPLQALRISVGALRRATPPGSRLYELLVRYLYASWQTAAQEAACHRHHSAERRCARWLLMTYDRARTRRFGITHEMLATMLGTRRATVTEALHTLQQAGLIRYTRGQMTVLDRAGLERAACECYAAIRRVLDSVVQPADCPAFSCRPVAGSA